MDRFVFEVIEPLISKDLPEEKRQERVKRVTEQLRAFTKGELVPLNKELAKKSRELFVASSDIETLKENAQAFEKEGMKLRSEIAMKENELVKQKMAFERDTEEIKEEIKTRKKEIKELIKKSENDLRQTNEQWKDKLIDTKKQLIAEHKAVMQAEESRHEEEVQHLRQTFSAEKQHLIQQSSAEKSKLIKKYEQKIYTLKNQTDEAIQVLTKDFNSKIEELKKTKGDLLNRLNTEEMNVRRLTMQLEREVSQHSRFKSQFQSTFKELENNRGRNEDERTRMAKELQDSRSSMKEMERQLNGRIRELQTELKSTVQQKDKRYNNTVQLLSTERRVEVDSLRNNMMEEKEMALNSFEVKSYEEMFQQMKRYQKLQSEFKQLDSLYKSVKTTYEVRFRQMEREHELFVNNLQQREDYERSLSGESSKREYNNLLNKFNLEIRSLKNQQAVDLENQQKKYQEDKIALSNKMSSQYEGMLADQRSNTEIQLKQKYVESQRKAKAYEKRIGEAEKRKSQLKVVIERMKIESQMKIESMMEVNQKLQAEIEDLHERILDLQKSKASVINDYEYQILLLRNEMEKIKEDGRQREDDLRANLNERIVVKNKEMAKLSEKIKLETDELIRKNKQRISILEKEYEELKRVIKQRTSLPQDMEALKVFHAAYLEKENELIAERKKREEVQRELHSKEAIDKVFIGKEAFKKFTVLDKMAQTSKGFKVRGLP